MLAPLADGGARHLHTMRLLLRVHAALNHHDQMFSLARALVRRNALPRQEADQLIDASGAARLRAAAANDGWRAIWKDLKAEERLLPEIALAGAAAFEAAGEAAEAARVLEAAVAVKFNPALVAAYARCDASQVSRRLARAESWLQSRPTDPELLTALGMLCLNGQLWGQAERYLLRSVSRRNDAQTHALLGSLYDRLERPADAVRHWRLATAASMALPVLATDAALPAADTGSDPYRVDAEGGYAVASPTWTTRPARSPATRPCRPPRPSPTMCWIPTPASARNSTTARWRPKTRARRRHQRLRRVFRQRACRRPLSRTRCPRTRRRRPRLPSPRPPRPLPCRHQAAVQERRRALIISSDTHKVEP